MRHRLLQGLIAFPAYAVTSRLRNLDAFLACVAVRAFRWRRLKMQFLRPSLSLMLRFGDRATLDACAATGVSHILVPGMRSEAVTRQSAAHGGRGCLLEEQMGRLPESGRFRARPSAWSGYSEVRPGDILDELFPRNALVHRHACAGPLPSVPPNYLGSMLPRSGCRPHPSSSRRIAPVL